MSIFVKNFFDGRLAVSAERVAGVTFLKIFNKNGRLTRGGGLSPLRCLFSPPIALASTLVLLSMRCCFVLLLYGAWWAPLVMFFVMFGRWGAGLGLPSVGFVNAV